VGGVNRSIDAVRVLQHALDQTGDVLAQVHADHLDRPTPCHDWNVQRLVDHLVATPGRFLQLMRGERVDWSAVPPHVEADWAGAFRVSADDLIHHWHELGEESAPVSADWQTAELATHTWDLARALGRPTDELDAEVAERGLAFMRDNLTADNRGEAFGEERSAPAGASPYDRLAAFAGRAV
jgi:uncharacterized protein (TIGR03086 family)